MADEKKPQKDNAWGKMETPMANLGRNAGLISILAAAIILIFAIITAQRYNTAMILASINSGSPIVQGLYQAQAMQYAFVVTWNIISIGMIFVLLFIYVIKPFGAKCAAKDWNSLIGEKIGTRFPKAWLMAILLAIFSYGAGSVGLVVPVIWIWFFGPGKGKTSSDQKKSS